MQKALFALCDMIRNPNHIQASLQNGAWPLGNSARCPTRRTHACLWPPRPPRPSATSAISASGLHTPTLILLLPSASPPRAGGWGGEGRGARCCRHCRADGAFTAAAVRIARLAGIVQCLLDLLVHKDDVVRQKTTEALLHFAGHAIGRDAIVSQGLIKALSGLFSDPSAVVRLNVHKTIERTSTAQNAAMQLVRLNLITTLLDALKAERESEIQTFILKTLYNTMKVDTDCLLGNKAMDTFVDLIQSCVFIVLCAGDAASHLALWRSAGQHRPIPPPRIRARAPIPTPPLVARGPRARRGVGGAHTGPIHRRP